MEPLDRDRISWGITGMIMPKPITSIRTVTKINDNAAVLFFIIQKPSESSLERFGLESRIKKQN